MSNPITIIVGSRTDVPVMQGAYDILDFHKVQYDTVILSAHRTPNELMNYLNKIKQQSERQVIIAGAGQAAHLPGFIASQTTLPVIGVPIKAEVLDGLDALLSIVQMPTGVPVATVGINNSSNAALLAIRIISLRDKSLLVRYKSFLDKLRDTVLNCNVNDE